MSKPIKDDVRPEYDLRTLAGRSRAKHHRDYAASTNVVVIDDDLLEAFPNGESVNAALRELLERRKTERR